MAQVMSEFVDKVTNVEPQLVVSFDEGLDHDMERCFVHSDIDDVLLFFSKLRERFSTVYQFLD